MADNFSALRTSRGEPSLFEQVRTTAQLTPEAQYEMTSGASDTQFEKGLRSGAAGLTAGSFANQALSQEVGGNEDWQRSRDLALQTQAQGHMYAPRVSSLRDIGSLEDAGDYAAGAVGQGAMSMAPTLATALLTRGRGKFGTATSYAGGATTAYGLERGEAALNQYADPTLAATSAEDRDLAATTKGVINAGLESIVPTGLAGSVLRKPAGSFLGHVGRASLTEGLTEAAQQGVGFGAEKYLDPNRQLDPWDVADAFAAGALTGGGMSAATRGPAHGAQALADRFARGPEAAPVQEQGPAAEPPMEGAPPGTPLLPAPDDGSGGVGDLFDTLNERFGPGLREKAQKTKDYVSDTVDRMGEAAKTAQSPGDFLRQVFGNSVEDAAASDLRPDTEDPGVLNSADPAAAMQQRDAQRQERAASFAAELLNDPATPESIKERVASFGGDFTNPEARAFVARNLVSQRAGEKLASAVGDLIDLSKDFGGKAAEVGTDLAAKARGMIDKGMSAAANRIVKKNLQNATPAEQATFNKLVFDSLTDEAKASPAVRQRLPELANSMLAFAARTGDLTKADLKTLSRMQDGLAMFRDPEALAAQLTEYAGLPRTEDSFLSRVKRVTNAQQDILQPNSFLYSSLSEDAKDSLSQPQLKQLARLVDDFTLSDSSKAQGDKVLAGLTAAFGSKESAQAVLDYYQQQNRADLRFDPNEMLTEGGTTERDGAPAPTYQFADAKAMRPYRAFAGQMSSEGGMRRRLRESTIAGAALRRSSPGGARVRPVKMSQYVTETKGNPEAEIKRIAADLKDRIDQHKARKDEDRSQQINQLQGELTLMRQAYKDGGAQAALDLYEVLQVSGQERNDTIASDEDVAKMATLADAKDAKETRVTFQREDGSKFTLSAESMWKTLGDKEGSGKGENAQARAKRLFADAAASVLARPEVAKMVTPMEKILIDRKLGVQAKKKSNPEYREMVAEALRAAEGSIKRLESTLDAVVDEYLDAADNEAKSEEYGSRREEIEGVIEKNIDQLSERLDAAREGEGPMADNMPAQAVARQKLRMYRDAQNQIDAVKFDEAFDERDNNRSGVPGADDAPKDFGSEYRRLERQRADLQHAYDVAYDSGDTAKIAAAERALVAVQDNLKNTEAREAVERSYGSAGWMAREGRGAGTRYSEEDTGLGVGVEKRGSKSGSPTQKKGAKTELPPVDKGVADALRPVLGAYAKEGSRIAQLDDAGYDAWHAQAVRDMAGGKDAEKNYMLTSMLDRFVKLYDHNGVREDINEAKRSKNWGASTEGKVHAALEAIAGKAEAKAGPGKGPAKPEAQLQERVVLPKTSPYAAKDQAKSDRANKFIGRGAPGSSTAAYAEAWGDRANTGVYASDDVVFISVNGNRPGALTPPWAEIKKAMSAGATLITDVAADRARNFNTGERAVADFLDTNGYFEESPGTWVRGYDVDNATGAKSYAPLGKQGSPDTRVQSSRIRKNSFVGAKSDPQGAADAEGLLGVGAPADVVWRELGWFRGPDGKLRKEVRSPVLRRRVRELAAAIAAGTAESTTIGALLEGIDAFKPYLDKLGNIPVRPNDLMVEALGAVGAYIPDDGGLSDAGIGLSRLNAEVAARLEAIPDGKGLEVIRDIANRLVPEDLRDSGLGAPDPSSVVAELERLHPLPDVEKRVADTLSDTIIHEMQHAFQHIEGFGNGGSPTTAVVAKYGDPDEFIAAMRDGDYETVEQIISQAFAQLRAEIGPDASPEDAAHALYESIVGEVEANDVAARMKLDDAEARTVAPALADAKREFVRSVMLAEALFTVRGMHSASSTMGAKKGRPGKIDRQKILDEIRRIRGDKVKVLFQKFSQIGGSGEFSMNKDKTERLIKIAVNAAHPLGVAWHESLHDFFAMLDETPSHRSIKKDLLDAAEAPQVKKRLRELLAKHPEALKQIEESPEERVAYMYQFWAEGLLTLGPTGTSVFDRVRQLFHDLFGLISTEQRASDLLEALHEGKFAEPSTVAEVLADMSGDRFSNKMEKAAPELTKALGKVFQTAPDRLRAYRNDTLNELADMFSSERGKLGFIQKRFQQQGVWENKLAGVLAGTTAQERRAALDNLQAMKTPSSKLEKNLAEFFGEMHGYMSEAGVKTLDSKTKKWVPLREVKGYFPRVFDRHEIMKDRAGFISLLQQHGNMDLKQANTVVDALTHGTGQLELAENEHALGFTPYAQAVQDRRLTFINPSNAADFAKYQVKDLADVTTGYVKQAVHRAEYSRMFGNDGEVITKMLSESGIKDRKELEDIGKVVQGLEGSLGSDMSSATKELMSGVMTLQNLVVLPLAIFSQMIDPVVLAARSGELKDAGNAYMTAIKRLTGKQVDGEELANMLGIISQDSVLEAMGAAYGTVHMSKRMRDINRVFFKYNGMQGWNNSMRIAATVAGERYILQNRKNKAALAELGLEPSDIKTVHSARGVKPDANNRLVLRERLKVDNPKVQQAMFRFVDQAVLRPSASNRPVWMSDPRFLLVAHLKQFTYAMHNVVLKRASRELADGNPKPWGILMLTLPAILAADMAKFALTGTAPSTWGFKDYLVHAVERSGLMGLGDFGVQATRGVDMGKMPGEELLGPTFENLMEILRWIGGDPRTGVGDVIDRTVPGSRFI